MSTETGLERSEGGAVSQAGTGCCGESERLQQWVGGLGCLGWVATVVKGCCMCRHCPGTQLDGPKWQAKRLSSGGRTQGEKGLCAGFQQTSLWPVSTACDKNYQDLKKFTR